MKEIEIGSKWVINEDRDLIVVVDVVKLEKNDKIQIIFYRYLDDELSLDWSAMKEYFLQEATPYVDFNSELEGL